MIRRCRCVGSAMSISTICGRASRCRAPGTGAVSATRCGTGRSLSSTSSTPTRTGMSAIRWPGGCRCAGGSIPASATPPSRPIAGPAISPSRACRTATIPGAAMSPRPISASFPRTTRIPSTAPIRRAIAAFASIRRWAASRLRRRRPPWRCRTTSRACAPSVYAAISSACSPDRATRMRPCWPGRWRAGITARPATATRRRCSRPSCSTGSGVSSPSTCPRA